MAAFWVLCMFLLVDSIQGTVLDERIEHRRAFFDHCPNGSVRHDSSCYLFSHDLANWPEAMVYCEAYGANLARIETDREQQFMANHLKSISPSTTDPGHYFWMGGTDAMSEGEWFWAKIYEPIQYSNWSPGNPNNEGSHHSKHQDCLAIYADSGLWDDGYCETRHNFICEITLNSEGSEVIG